MLYPTEKSYITSKICMQMQSKKTPSPEWVQNFPNLKEKSTCNKHFDWFPVLMTLILNKFFRQLLMQKFAIDNCKTKKKFKWMQWNYLVSHTKLPTHKAFPAVFHSVKRRCSIIKWNTTKQQQRFLTKVVFNTETESYNT